MIRNDRTASCHKNNCELSLCLRTSQLPTIRTACDNELKKARETKGGVSFEGGYGTITRERNEYNTPKGLRKITFLNNTLE